MNRVVVYSVGPCYASACAQEGTERQAIEAAVGRAYPTGLDHGWKIADEPFRTGEANPHPCNDSPNRLHYLLSC